MSTLEENMKYLSPRHRNVTNKTCEIYEWIGTPMMDDLKEIIWTNIIKNNKVTKNYVNLAPKAYVANGREIKGKTTRSRPKPVFSNIVEIPKELLEVQKNLTVSMDGLTVNSLKLISTIYHKLY